MQYKAETDAILHDYEAMDWSTVSPEGVDWMLHHGTEREAMMAVIEIIRRGDPKGRLLRWTQVMAILVARDGGVGNMQAGEGKTLVFLGAAALKAARGGPVKVITTRDVLANEAFDEYRMILGKFGFDIVRMNPDHPYAEPVDGKPTIYIGTMNDAGFGELRGNVAPARINGVDEIDEALVHADTTFILSEGSGNPASAEVQAQVTDAHAFLHDALKAGLITEFDFGRDPGQIGGGTALTDTGRAKIEDILGRPLTTEETHRLTMAATAGWEYIEDDHYVVWHHPELGPEFLTDSDGNIVTNDAGDPVRNPASHKIYIIDQTSHKVMFDAETSTESRWNGGLAQAVEAKHGIQIRDDPASSASVTAGKLFSSEKSDELFGFSGTADGVAEELAENHGVKRVVDIPRFKESQLKRIDDHHAIGQEGVISHQDAKLLAMAHVIAEGQPEGNPILAICNRNSEPAKLSKLLGDLGVEHVVVDAKFFLRHGVHAEAELQKIIAEAGKEGKVLVINRQGGRGVDIPVDPGIKGGLRVLISGRSAESRAVDIQAENRTARSGGEGSVQYFTAPDDALYAHTPQAQIAIIRSVQHENAVNEHRAALAEHAAAPTKETQSKLHRATNKLAASQKNLDEAIDNIRSVTHKLQPLGVRKPSTHDPATAHLPNSPPTTDPTADAHTPGQPGHPPPVHPEGEAPTGNPGVAAHEATPDNTKPGQPQQLPASTGSAPGISASGSAAPVQMSSSTAPDAAAGQPVHASGAQTASVSAALPQAQQGHPGAVRTLVNTYWPTTLQQVTTTLGCNLTSGTPAQPVQQLAHALAFAGLRSAELDRWSVPADTDLADWLHQKTDDALLDGLGRLNDAERHLVQAALHAQPRDLTPDQIDVLQRLTQVVHAQHRADDTIDGAPEPTGPLTSAPQPTSPGTAGPSVSLAPADSREPLAPAAGPVAAAPSTPNRATDARFPFDLIVAQGHSTTAPKMDPGVALDLKALQRGVVAAYMALEGVSESDPVVAALALAPLALFGRLVDRLHPSQREALRQRFRQGLSEEQTAYVHNARVTTGMRWHATGVRALAAGALRRIARSIAAEHGIPATPAELTAEELAVLELTAQGLSRAVIAQRLGLPRQTVTVTARQTAEKLNVPNRAASVAEATRRGDLDITSFPAMKHQATAGFSGNHTNVLTLTAKGLTRQSVAEILSMPAAELQNHLDDIAGRLGNPAPACLVAAGIREGLVDVNGPGWSNRDGTATAESPSGPGSVVTAVHPGGRPTPPGLVALDEWPIDTSTLSRAQAGDKAASQSLDRRYSRADVRRVLALLGWDPARGEPPTQIARLAHAIHFGVLTFARNNRWPVPAGQDIGDWMFAVAQDTLLDNLDHLGTADRQLVSAAIGASHRGEDLDDDQVAAIERLATVAHLRSRGEDSTGPTARTDVVAAPSPPPAQPADPAPAEPIANSKAPVAGLDEAFDEPGVAKPVGQFDPALVTAINPDNPIGSHTAVGGKPSAQPGPINTATSVAEQLFVDWCRTRLADRSGQPRQSLAEYAAMHSLVPSQVARWLARAELDADALHATGAGRFPAPSGGNATTWLSAIRRFLCVDPEHMDELLGMRRGGWSAAERGTEDLSTEQIRALLRRVPGARDTYPDAAHHYPALLTADGAAAYPEGYSHIGEYIQSLRESANLSRTALAESIGNSSSIVRLWENGKAAPPAETIERLTGVLPFPSEVTYGELAENYSHLQKDSVAFPSVRVAESFGEYLKHFRLLNNLKRADAARIFGLSKQTIQAHEEGTRETSDELVMLQAYDRALHRSGPWNDIAEAWGFGYRMDEAGEKIPDPADCKTPSDWVRAVRLYYRMSQSEFGARMRRSRARIAEMETSGSPGIDFTRDLRAVLGIPDKISAAALRKFYLRPSEQKNFLEWFRNRLNDESGLPRLSLTGYVEMHRLEMSQVRRWLMESELDIGHYQNEPAQPLPEPGADGVEAWLSEMRRFLGISPERMDELLDARPGTWQAAERGEGKLAVRHLRALLRLVPGARDLYSNIAQSYPELHTRDASPGNPEGYTFIGDYLRSLRARQKLTRQQLSNISGMPLNVIRNIETGRAQPPPEIVDTYLRSFSPRIAATYDEVAACFPYLPREPLVFPDPRASESFGEYLRHLRRINNLTRANAARILGLHPLTLRLHEDGETDEIDELHILEMIRRFSQRGISWNDLAEAWGFKYRVYPDGEINFDPELFGSLHDWLKAVRLNKRVSPEKLGELTGRHSSSIRRIERGLHRRGRAGVPDSIHDNPTKPTITYLRTLRDALGFPNEILVRALRRFYSGSGATSIDMDEEGLFWDLIATRPGSDEERTIRNQIYEKHAWIPGAVAPRWATSDDLRHDLMQQAAEAILAAMLNFVPPGNFTRAAWVAARYAMLTAYFERRFPDVDGPTRKLLIKVNAYINRRFGETGTMPDDAETARALGHERAEIMQARRLIEQRTVHLDTPLDPSSAKSGSLQSLAADPSASSAFADAEFTATMQQALSAMPDPDLAESVVLLHFIEELSLGEVSTRLRIPLHSAEQIIADATEILRAAYGSQDSAGPRTDADAAEATAGVPATDVIELDEYQEPPSSRDDQHVHPPQHHPWRPATEHPIVASKSNSAATPFTTAETPSDGIGPVESRPQANSGIPSFGRSSRGPGPLTDGAAPRTTRSTAADDTAAHSVTTQRTPASTSQPQPINHCVPHAITHLINQQGPVAEHFHLDDIWTKGVSWKELKDANTFHGAQPEQFHPDNQHSTPHAALIQAMIAQAGASDDTTITALVFEDRGTTTTDEYGIGGHAYTLTYHHTNDNNRPQFDINGRTVTYLGVINGRETFRTTSGEHKTLPQLAGGTHEETKALWAITYRRTPEMRHDNTPGQLLRGLGDPTTPPPETLRFGTEPRAVDESRRPGDGPSAHAPPHSQQDAPTEASVHSTEEAQFLEWCRARLADDSGHARQTLADYAAMHHLDSTQINRWLAHAGLEVTALATVPTAPFPSPDGVDTVTWLTTIRNYLGVTPQRMDELVDAPDGTWHAAERGETELRVGHVRTLLRRVPGARDTYHTAAQHYPALLAETGVPKYPEGYAHIGQYAQFLRESRGLSRSQLTKQLGKGKNTISRWDSGTARPAKDDVIALLDTVAADEEVSYDELSENFTYLPRDSVIFPSVAATESFGEYLRYLRRINHTSLADTGSLFGIPSETVRRQEAGIGAPSELDMLQTYDRGLYRADSWNEIAASWGYSYWMNPHVETYPHPDDYQSLHNWVRSLRLYRRMPQSEVATLVGTSEAWIGLVENKSRDPNIEFLRKLRDALNIPNDLLVVALRQFVSRTDVTSGDPAEERLFWELIATAPGSAAEKRIRNRIFEKYAWVPVAMASRWSRSSRHFDEIVQQARMAVLLATRNFVPPGEFTPAAMAAARYAMLRAYYEDRYPNVDTKTRNLLIKIDGHITRRLRETGSAPTDAEICETLDLDPKDVAATRAVLGRQVSEISSLEEDDGDNRPRQFVDQSASPFTDIEFEERLVQALADLPDPDLAKRIVTLTLVAGYSPEEAAAQVRMTTVEVLELITEASERLRAEFRPTTAEAEQSTPGVGTDQRLQDRPTGGINQDGTSPWAFIEDGLRPTYDVLQADSGSQPDPSRITESNTRALTGRGSVFYGPDGLPHTTTTTASETFVVGAAPGDYRSANSDEVEHIDLLGTFDNPEEGPSGSGVWRFDRHGRIEWIGVGGGTIGEAVAHPKFEAQVRHQLMLAGVDPSTVHFGDLWRSAMWTSDGQIDSVASYIDRGGAGLERQIPGAGNYFWVEFAGVRAEPDRLSITITLNPVRSHPGRVTLVLERRNGAITARYTDFIAGEDPVRVTAALADFHATAIARWFAESDVALLDSGLLAQGWALRFRVTRVTTPTAPNTWARTYPSQRQDGQDRSPIASSAVQLTGHRSSQWLQNRSAELLAQAGYLVAHSTKTASPTVRPAYQIEDRDFGHLAPDSDSAADIAHRLIESANASYGMLSRWVVNLNGSRVAPADLATALYQAERSELVEVIAIDSEDNPVALFARPERYPSALNDCLATSTGGVIADQGDVVDTFQHNPANPRGVRWKDAKSLFRGAELEGYGIAEQPAHAELLQRLISTDAEGGNRTGEGTTAWVLDQRTYQDRYGVGAHSYKVTYKGVDAHGQHIFDVDGRRVIYGGTDEQGHERLITSDGRTVTLADLTGGTTDTTAKTWAIVWRAGQVVTGVGEPVGDDGRAESPAPDLRIGQRDRDNTDESRGPPANGESAAPLMAEFPEGTPLAVMPADVSELISQVTAGQDPPAVELSPPELELLNLAVHGLTFDHIAARMGVSRHVMRTHLARAGKKLGTKGLLSTVVAALNQGLLDIGALDLTQPLSNSAAHGVLSPREYEVLEQAAQGLSNKAIGKRLGIAQDTVDEYLQEAGRKLGARGRVQIVVQAMLQRVLGRAGYVELTEGEVYVVRLLADGLPETSLGAVLGMPPDQVNHLLAQLNSRITAADGVRMTTTAHAPTGRIQLSPTQVGTLHLLVEGLPDPAPGGTPALLPNTLQEFRTHLANRPTKRLSGREREVLGLIASGQSPNGIAERLGVPPSSVRDYIAHAGVKLHTDGLIPTVLAAVRAGELADGADTVNQVRLSPLERRVLRMVADGHTNQAIGTVVGQRWAKPLLARLYAKFGVDSKMGLALAAQRRDLLTEKRLLECIGQVSEAAAALGLENAAEPQPGQNNPRYLQAALTPGSAITEQAITTQLVPTHLGPNAKDPLAHVIADVRNMKDGADTAVILLDDGTNMHAYLVTNADGRKGGNVVIFDTNITDPADPHPNPNDPGRVPRVRTHTTWTQSYPRDKITAAYVALLKSDDGDLSALYPPTADHAPPRDGAIRGRPGDQPRHSGSDDAPTPESTGPIAPSAPAAGNSQPALPAITEVDPGKPATDPAQPATTDTPWTAAAATADPAPSTPAPSNDPRLGTSPWHPSPAPRQNPPTGPRNQDSRGRTGIPEPWKARKPAAEIPAPTERTTRGSNAVPVEGTPEDDDPRLDGVGGSAEAQAALARNATRLERYESVGEVVRMLRTSAQPGRGAVVVDPSGRTRQLVWDGRDVIVVPDADSGGRQSGFDKRGGAAFPGDGTRPALGPDSTAPQPNSPIGPAPADGDRPGAHPGARD
ncbi:LuxR C-terminal-related transcriptional regulator, partial [Nocardia miyunensis]|uniref:LuxR C-terminal-related transcriptional regulator n=1 Tax=Nocardia miyunensis TaxID=282684 RepID=UPI001471D205